ncbi:DDE-domain-containing protein [Atractiella rhizophila]|nr:DDE-domain-containing protein [Atractiella rhizophila]
MPPKTKEAHKNYAEKNKGMNLEEQAQHWRKNGFDTLNIATLSRYFKDKDKIRKEVDESDNLAMKKRHVVTYPEVEAALIQWVKQAASPCVGLKKFKFHGEAGSVDLEAVKEERLRLQLLLKAYAERDRFKGDETAIFWNMADSGLAQEATSSVKRDKARLSNRTFQKKTAKQLGFNHYYWNKKAWMTGSIFQDWLSDLGKDMRKKNCKIVLLIDNAPSHIWRQEMLTNVHVEPFKPNMTSFVKPMDAGFFKATKAHYYRCMVHADRSFGTFRHKEAPIPPNPVDPGLVHTVSDLSAMLKHLNEHHIPLARQMTAEQLLSLDGEGEGEGERTKEEIVEEVQAIMHPEMLELSDEEDPDYDGTVKLKPPPTLNERMAAGQLLREGAMLHDGEVVRQLRMLCTKALKEFSSEKFAKEFRVQTTLDSFVQNK